MARICVVLALLLVVGCGESRQGLTAAQREGCAKMLSLAHGRRDAIRLYISTHEEIIALEKSLGTSKNTPQAREAIAAALRSQSLYDQGIADIEAALLADAPGALDRAFENIEQASNINLAPNAATPEPAPSR